MFGSSMNLESIDTSSKMSLKVSCLKACDNNVQKARELYEFLSEGIIDIPDATPIRPNSFEQVKLGATEVFGWLSEHRDDVAQGISFIQSLRRPAVVSDQPSLAPIPKI